MSKFLNSRRFVVYLMLILFHQVGIQEESNSISEIYIGTFTMLVMISSYEIGFRMIAAMINYGRAKL